MNINLKARFRNKAFWVSFIAAIILLIQQLGFRHILPDNINDIVNTVLAILTMLGILIDPSTPGVEDITKIEDKKE